MKLITLRRALIINAVIVAAVLVYVFLRTGNSGSPAAGITSIVSRVNGGEQSVPLLQIIAGYGFYLSKLIYPFPLNFAIIRINYVWNLLILLPMLFMSGFLFHRRQKVRLPILIVLVGIIPPLFAFIGRLPWTPFAERYLYLPMSGFCIVSSILLIDFFSIFPDRPKLLFSKQAGEMLHFSQKKFPFLIGMKPVISVLVILLFLFLGFATFKRVSLWTDAVAFWHDTVTKSPEFHRAHAAYAAALMDVNRNDEAEVQLNIAASQGLNQDFLWKHFAAIYLARRDYRNYENAMMKAVKISSKPTQIYLQLINSLDIIYGSDKEKLYEKTIQYSVQAYERDPDYIEGLYNAAKLYWILNNREKAMLCLRKFLAQKNDSIYKPFAASILAKLEKSKSHK